MLSLKEYKFIKKDRFNAICELNPTEIAWLSLNPTSVKFDLAYPAYLNFEILFKTSTSTQEKLIPASRMSKGAWIYTDLHLTTSLHSFLKENQEIYEENLVLQQARIFHTFNKIFK